MDSTPQRAHDLSQRLASASRHSAQQLHSTPRERHGQIDPGTQTLRDQATSLGRKTGQPIQVTAETVLADLEPDYKHQGFGKWLELPPPPDSTKDDSEVLKIYNREKHRFRHLPQVATTESSLYGTFTDIFAASLDEFVVPECGEGVAREIHNTHNIPLLHKEGHRTSPDFIVRGSGPSFETPHGKDELGFASVATFLDAKRDKVLYSDKNIRQMAIYSYQLFAYQPNRMFVRCALVSEKRFIALHFDRAGLQMSSQINYSNKPERLIQLIVGLSSPDEKKLGFDTSIQWKIHKGKKASGTIKMRDSNGQEIEYQMANVHPIAHTFGIRGRGTTCWAVRDPADETKELVIKDSWTSEGRIPEHEHLAKAKDIRGIARLVAYEERGIDTKSLRFESPSSAYFNRYAQRVVIERHGSEIQNFTSPLQALKAIRSAVVTLMELFAMNIIHRDISNKNILLGREGDDGPEGVVIDLGVALDFGPDREHTITKEPRSGSRFFESTISLDHSSDLSVDDTPAHDFLDDLEGIFDLICFLFFQFLPTGEERRKRDPARIVVKGWDSALADDALPPKAILFDPLHKRRKAAIDIVTETWGPACGTLFKSYLEWVYEVKKEKTRLIQEYNERREAEKNSPFKDDGPKKEEKEEEEYQEGSGHWPMEWDPELNPGEEDEDKGDKEQGDRDKEDNNHEPERDEAGGDGEEEMGPEFEGEEEILFQPAIKLKKPPPLERGIFASVQNPAEGHWLKVISFFDTAITNITVDPDEQGPPPPPDAPDKGKERKRQYSTEVSPLRARVAKASRVSQPSQPT